MQPEPLNAVREPRQSLDGATLAAALRTGIHRLISREEVERRLTRYVMARQVEGVLERKRPKAS